MEEVSIDGGTLVPKEFLDFTSLKAIESRVAGALGLDLNSLEWSATDDGVGAPAARAPAARLRVVFGS